MFNLNISNGFHSFSQRFNFPIHGLHFVCSNQVCEQLVDTFVPAHCSHCIELSSHFVTYTDRGHPFACHDYPEPALFYSILNLREELNG